MHVAPIQHNMHELMNAMQSIIQRLPPGSVGMLTPIVEVPASPSPFSAALEDPFPEVGKAEDHGMSEELEGPPEELISDDAVRDALKGREPSFGKRSPGDRSRSPEAGGGSIRARSRPRIGDSPTGPAT